MNWDDATCRKNALIDNLGRADLRPIERIRACRELLNSGAFQRQLDLAKALGIEPATLSNQLRTLELPEPWLDWISQEKYGLSVTHARSLLKWSHRSQVLAAVAADLTAQFQDSLASGDFDDDEFTDKDAGELFDAPAPLTVDELTRLLDRFAMSLSRPLSGYDWAHAKGEVQLTKKQQQDLDLDVEEVGQHKERRAWNIELWTQYQTAGELRRKKSAEKRGVPATASEAADSGTDRVAQQAEQQAKRLYRHKLKSLQSLIGDRILKGISAADRLRLLLWFVTSNDTQSAYRRGDVLSDRLAEQGIKHVAGQYGFGADGWVMALQAKDASLEVAVTQSLAELWSQGDFEGYHRDVTPAAIEAVANQLGVSFEAGWLPTEEFLTLLSLDALWSLDNEWGTHLAEREHKTKAALIAGLLASPRKKPLPVLLRKLPAVKL